MKICSNCSSAGFDRYRFHEHEPEILTAERSLRPAPPIKLFRCLDCGITYNQQEYDELELLSPPGT